MKLLQNEARVTCINPCGEMISLVPGIEVNITDAQYKELLRSDSFNSKVSSGKIKVINAKAPELPKAPEAPEAPKAPEAPELSERVEELMEMSKSDLISIALDYEMESESNLLKLNKLKISTMIESVENSGE